MKEQIKRKLDDLQRIVRDYPKLKDKIGKKRVLQRVKIRLRSLPDNETKVMVAFQTIGKFTPRSEISSREIIRRIECLTDLDDFEISTILNNHAETLKSAGIIRECDDDDKWNEIRAKESIIDPEDAAINEYCEVELKRKYQGNLTDVMRAYS